MSRPVIVVGTGAAGLAAALAAARAGAAVTLLESTATVGGTTALSGGVAWVPNNHRAAELGFPDDLASARTYLDGLALGDVEPDLVERFLVAGPDIVRDLEATTPLTWRALPYPDYHAPLPGGREGGRSLEPEPLPVPPDIDAQVRPALSWRLRVSHSEVIAGDLDRDRAAARERDGVQTMGSALVAGLLQAALAAGVTLRTGVRAHRLRQVDGRVVGVVTDAGELTGQVILATGGFERDPQLARSFLRVPAPVATGAPGATGDGLRMALQVGASLGNMSEAWWCPAITVPDETVDGAPLSRLILNERARPGSLMVDQRGRRFCNEAQNYNDVGRALHSFDPGGFRFERDPAWLVFDATYRRRYAVGPTLTDDPTPAWWVTADDLPSLAEGMGVDATELIATVDRFAAAAEAGDDPDFGRGRSAYDRFVGDGRAPSPNLRAPSDPPYFAVPVRAGLLGTKGGPRTDGDGRVLDLDGEVIAGLYAVGNAAASPLGMAYPGAGGTLGPALVFGTLAGQAAAV